MLSSSTIKKKAMSSRFWYWGPLNSPPPKSLNKRMANRHTRSNPASSSGGRDNLSAPTATATAATTSHNSPQLATVEISAVQHTELVRTMTLRRFHSAHEYVFRQGDHGQEFFILLEGSVEVQRQIGSLGVSRTVARLTLGGSFGELALTGGGGGASLEGGDAIGWSCTPGKSL